MWLILRVFALVVSVGASVVNWTDPSLEMFERRADKWDYEDLTGIKRLAAVGDSYSAGIGAGNRLGSLTSNIDAWKCTSPGCQFSHSAIVLISYRQSL